MMKVHLVVVRRKLMPRKRSATTVFQRSLGSSRPSPRSDTAGTSMITADPFLQQTYRYHPYSRCLMHFCCC